MTPEEKKRWESIKKPTLVLGLLAVIVASVLVYLQRNGQQIDMHRDDKSSTDAQELRRIAGDLEKH